MKKLNICIIFLVLIFLPVFGQSEVDFNNLIDFVAKLEDLCYFVETQPAEVIEAVIQQNRVFIVTGTIAAREIINPERDTFIGEFELVSGAWQGLDNVQMYRAILQFNGPEYYAMIPARRSRTANPNEVTINSFVMVPVLLAGVRDYEGKQIPVLEGIGMRILD